MSMNRGRHVFEGCRHLDGMNKFAGQFRNMGANGMDTQDAVIVGTRQHQDKAI